MSNNKNPYFDFYDEVAEKYSVNINNRASSSAYGYCTSSSQHYERYAAGRIKKRLLIHLKEIANRSGFNTNAPDSLYEEAKNIFEELENKISQAVNDDYQSYNKKVVDQAKWALFSKFDYMEAITHVERIRLM